MTLRLLLQELVVAFPGSSRHKPCVEAIVQLQPHADCGADEDSEKYCRDMRPGRVPGLIHEPRPEVG